MSWEILSNRLESKDFLGHPDREIVTVRLSSEISLVMLDGNKTLTPEGEFPEALPYNSILKEICPESLYRGPVAVIGETLLGTNDWSVGVDGHMALQYRSRFNAGFDFPVEQLGLPYGQIQPVLRAHSVATQQLYRIDSKQAQIFATMKRVWICSNQREYVERMHDSLTKQFPRISFDSLDIGPDLILAPKLPEGNLSEKVLADLMGAGRVVKGLNQPLIY